MSFVDITIDYPEAKFLPEIDFDQIISLAKQKIPKTGKQPHNLVFMISLALSYIVLYMAILSNKQVDHYVTPPRRHDAKHKYAFP